MTCILLTTCISWTVFSIYPTACQLNANHNLLFHKVNFWSPSLSLSIHGSVLMLSPKYRAGESNTTTHVTSVSVCALLQVWPIKTHTNIDLLIDLCTVYMYKHTSAIYTRCNQMTALTELKSENITNKQHRNVIAEQWLQKARWLLTHFFFT